MPDARPHDIVIFGATGFTGGLTCEYLAASAEAGKRNWALAGRNRAKLEAVRERLAAINSDCANLDLIEVDVNDTVRLDEVVAQTRVVVTTIGPYIHYGEPLLAACAAAGTDYVDLTGEPEFVDLALDKYDAKARETAARIVNCCGFDSIPHDLGVLFTVDQLPRDTPITIKGFVRAGGTFSGGTWHSAIHAMARLREHSRKRRGRKPPAASNGRKVGSVKTGIHRASEVGAWAVPFPTIDPEVVKRSARALDEYGPDFRYGHYAAVKRTATLAVGGLVMGGIFTGAQFGPTRRLLLSVRDPGEGPSAEQRAKGWFKVRFLAEAGDVRIQTQVSGGDPGYGDTAKMLGESALCLAAGESPSKQGGVLTPAVALGRPMIERLKRAGMRFEILD